MAGDPRLRRPWPEPDDYEARAFEILDPGIECPEDGLRAIGFALLNLKDDSTVVAMREHAAEHDCVLELRLIDLDTFGVTCSRHKEFHLEWRT